MPFTIPDLQSLVEIAGTALEAEHRYLSHCQHVRGWVSGRVGLRAMTNTRYYQQIIWRALMCSFRWRADIEAQTYDLVFFDGESTELVARAAVRGSWGNIDRGVTDATKRDMKLLAEGNIPGIILLMSHHPIQESDRALQSFASGLAVERQQLVTYSFEIPPLAGDDAAEFMVIGFFAPTMKSR